MCVHQIAQCKLHAEFIVHMAIYIDFTVYGKYLKDGKSVDYNIMSVAHSLGSRVWAWALLTLCVGFHKCFLWPYVAYLLKIAPRHGWVCIGVCGGFEGSIPIKSITVACTQYMHIIQKWKLSIPTFQLLTVSLSQICVLSVLAEEFEIISENNNKCLKLFEV